jgi:hypothetical protein
MLRRIQEATGETPRALAIQPELPEHLKYYLELFQELSDSRHYSGMGEPRPLVLKDFLEYAGLWQFTRVEAQEMWEVVRRIDTAWLRLYVKRRETEPKKPVKKPS